jgi:hypothetical protein
MAKIRISEKDKKEYNKLKNAVKSKVKRTLNNYGINLENEVSIPSLSEFSTRSDFNQWKAKANSFMKNAKYKFRKNKNGLVASVAQLNEWQRLSTIERNIAKKKKKEYANQPFMRHGEKIGTVGERFGMLKRPKNIGFSVPSKFDFNNYHTREALERRIKVMEGRARTGEFDRRLATFKENFIAGVEKTFNNHADDLVRKLESLPANVLYDMYLENDEFQNLMYRYTKDDYNGIQTLDDNAGLETMYDIEKIVDAKLERRHDNPLENFPTNW